MISRRAIMSAGAAATALVATGPALAQNNDVEATDTLRVGPVGGWEGKGAVEQSDTSISVADSPLPNALDMYYSFLLGIAQDNGATTQQKLLVNNTIIPFDISQDTPYYNEGLFRNFVDRVFMKSPQAMGPANRADRFSLHYENAIKAASLQIDRKHPEILPELDGLQRKLDDQTQKLADRIVKINEQWRKVANSTGLKDTDPAYDLKYLNFLESVRYADQIDQYSQNIDMITGTMDAVRRDKYKIEELLILDNLAQLSKTKKLARPKRPQFERTVKDVNELTFADPTVRNESLMDISPSMYPLGDLVRFLKFPGVRSLSIDKTSVAKEQHDRSWSAGGSVSYSFFSVGGSGSGSSSTRQDIKKAGGVGISFENIAEYLVDRELWFNPAVFQDEKLAAIMKKIPGVERLQYVAVSLIIARGLTLQLTFESSIETESWSKRSFAASGGVSVFGFGFSASGSNSSYDYNLNISTDRRTVTFKDDPQLSRVLAVRLEPLINVPSGRLQIVDGEAADPNSPLGKFLSGKISYLELQASKLKP